MTDPSLQTKNPCAGIHCGTRLIIHNGPTVYLCEKLAIDKNVSAKLSVSNQHASYSNTHGLAPEFKKRLWEKLKQAPFSMNIDDATNLNTDKVLNVLVRFFDDDTGRVIIQHLASRKVKIANLSAVV